jgi:amino acid adenylation domain-containing protein
MDKGRRTQTRQVKKSKERVMLNRRLSAKVITAANQNIKERDYWLAKLSGELSKSCFPYDCGDGENVNIKNVKEDKRRIDTAAFKLEGEIYSVLMEISKGTDPVLHMVLVAAVAALLYKYNYDTRLDTLIGSPIYKQDGETEFINTALVLRNQVEHIDTFKQLLLRVRQTLIEADTYQNYPVELLPEKLNMSYLEGDDFPLFDISVLLENIQNKRYLEHINHKMTFSFNRKEDVIEGIVEYNALLYRKPTIERIVTHFVLLLKRVLFNLDNKLSTLGILSEEEKKQVLVDFNNTEVKYPVDTTVHRLFEEQVERSGDKIAVIGMGHAITYNELNEKSNQLAQVLVEKGVEPDTIVGIITERSIEMVIGLLGILKAGGTYMPIDPDYPVERIHYMLSDSNAKVLLTDNKDNIPAGAGGLAPLYLPLEDNSAVHNPQLAPCHSHPATSPENIAYVIYTSGTTGKPKGMMIEHRNVVQLMASHPFMFDFDSFDVWTLFHSYCFDFSVWEMYGALLYGGKLVIIPRMVSRDPAAYLEVLKDQRVTVLNQTPSAFYNLMAEELKQPDKTLVLKYVIFGGEALNPGRLGEWKTRYPDTRLINMFGITETTVHVTYKEIEEEDIVSGRSNIGAPLPTLNTYVMNRHLGLLPAAVPGECCVGGAGVGRGYLNRPGLTGEKFVDNPYNPGERLYRSGDLVKLSDKREMEYFGRIDHQVKIRGFRVELGEIEAQLLKHDAVKETVVIAKTRESVGEGALDVADAEGDERYLCAYIVCDNPLTVSELREYLSGKLPGYMIPAYFIPLDKIPLTPNGKVDRKALPGFSEIGESLEDDAAPIDETEKKLAEIWKQILGLETVGINIDFFNAGGDSIKAIRLINSINKELSSHLAIPDLYLSGTIKKLADKIERDKSVYTNDELEGALKEIEALKNRIMENNAYNEWPGDIEDLYPMSDIEKGMVFYTLKNPDIPLYHDQLVYQVKIDDFDPGIFKKAFIQLVEKHSILRTAFFLNDNEESIQIVYKKIPHDIAHDDISGMEKDEQEAFLRAFLEEDRKKALNIEVAPLWRVRTFHSGNGNIFILLVTHHAILDGWSAASLVTELYNTYWQLRSNPTFVPERLKSSYKEFVVEQMIEKKRSATVDFWRNELKGYKRLDFPNTLSTSSAKVKNQEDEAVKSYRYRYSLEKGLLGGLKNIAKKYNTTVKHLCFAAYLYMLNMLTYENEIVVGLVSNNRPLCEDGDKILGCFLNTIPVRMNILSDITWLDHIHMVEKKMLELKKYERMPLFEIIRIVGESTQNRNPIFDAVFNFVDFHVFNQIEGNDTEPVGVGEKTRDRLSVQGYVRTNTLLDFTVSTTFEDFEIYLLYSESIFNGGSGDCVEMVIRLCQYFERGLNMFIYEPERPAGKDELLSIEEKQKLLYDFNDTEVEYPGDKTIDALFEGQVEQFPGHIAVVYEDRHLSYKELDDRSTALAGYLRARGVEPDMAVGISMESSLEMIIGILGILKAGGAYLPINTNYPEKRKKYIIDDSNIKLMVTRSRNSENVVSHMVHLDNPGIYRYRCEYDLKKKHGFHNLAYILYTSGSTGKPKGVMVEHRNVIRLVKKTDYIHFRPDEKILQMGALEFDASTFEIWGALLNGAELYLVERDILTNAQKIKEILKKNKITTILMITPVFHQMVQADIEIFSDLKNFVVGGDVLSPLHISRLRGRFPQLKIINAYGPTENTTISTTFSVEKEYKEIESVPIGKPITNSKAYIVDKNNKLQPIGIMGELCVGGDGVARGYLNNPALTVEKFDQDFQDCQDYQDEKETEKRTGKLEHMSYTSYLPYLKRYHTGDLARWLPCGNMEFGGRIDFQVKIRGFRIELGEIESQLLSHKDIKEAKVLSKEDKKGGKYLCAYIVARSMEHGAWSESAAELKEYLSGHLPAYMVPSYFIFLEQIPLTPIGKIDKDALPEPEIKAGKDIEYIAPRDWVEEKLVEIWSEVLGLRLDTPTGIGVGIGINDNFFQLGGHSLKATALGAKIHKEFNIKLPLAELFINPTVRELADHIKGLGVRKDTYASIEPTEKREYYPLSSAQRRLFVLHQMVPGSTGYNIPAVVELKGEVNIDQLEKAFKGLIQRHESLRTSFRMKDGEPIQRIHDTVEFKFKLYDLTAKRREETRKENKIHDFIRPFELSQSPLLRVGLLKTVDNSHILVYDMHHIITDGVSQRILTAEFISLYAGKELSPLHLCYRDYSQWQQDQLKEAAIEQQEQFWLEVLGGEVPLLNLPFDYPRPAVQSFEGNVLNFELDQKESGMLNKIARTQGATLFMVLLAAYNILLSKLCNQEDIVIGTPTAGRGHVDLEQIIGMFVNTLALRNHPLGEKTAAAFLNEVKERTLEAFENQDFPFEDLVEKLPIQRDTSRNPVFDVVFVLQNIAADSLDGVEKPMEGLEVKACAYDNRTSKFDLTLTAVEEGDILRFSFEYCTRLFRPETISRFIFYFKKIIASILKNPHIRISEIEIISDEEKQEILYEFNNADIEYPYDKTVDQLFEEQVERSGDKIAVIGMGYAITYNELNGKSNQLARGLMEKGVEPDTIVGIIAERSIEMVIGLLGILKAGGAYMPIDPDYPVERIHYMLSDSNAKVLLTDNKDNIPAGAGGLAPLYLPLEDNSAAYNLQLAPRNSHPATSPENIAYIIYTSGTTGKPKGMMIEHRNVVQLMVSHPFMFDFDSFDVWTLFHSYCFDFSVWEMYGALLYGGKLVIIPRMVSRDPAAYLEVLKNQAVTVLNQTPSAFYNLMAEELKQPDKILVLKYVIFGGEALNPGRLGEWKARYPKTRLINMFGITETTVHVTYKEIGEEDIVSGKSNIGDSLPPLNTYVMDRHLKLLPAAVPGECCVGGAGVGRGYLNRPGLTGEKFVENPYNPEEKLYRSGDLVKLSDNGEMEYFGRIDHQVKIRGFRVELGEIETQLLKHDEIKEVVVTAKEVAEGANERYLCAYIVSDKEQITSELREYLSEKLPEYMIPSYFVQVEHIPLTPNGKIDRKALPDPGIKAGEGYIAPGNDTEEKLADIWSHVLGIEKEVISTDKSFFEVGGHSLKATILVTEIHRELNVKLPLAEVFIRQTIKGLAQFISQSKGDKYVSIEPVPRKEYYALSSAQKRLYFLQQMDLNSTSYNMPFVLPLGKNIEKNKLESTLKKLIVRHEGLRTSFERVDEVPVQKIHKTVDFFIEYFDMTTGEKSEPEELHEKTRRIIEHFVRPFDLRKAPLIRSGLITLPDNNHIWMVDIHHIVSDGTSHAILTEDFKTLYEGKTLKPLRLQYKDFSEWQNRLFESGKIKAQEDYWLSLYSDAGEIPRLQLATDYKRPEVFTFAGDHYEFVLDREDVEKFKALGSRNGGTLYMNILAALNTLFYKYTRQSDIIIGTGIAGRSHADIQQIMGMFVNTLAMRNYPGGETSYEAFLLEVITNSIKAYENQDIQFEELVDRLDLERDPSRNPLFDISMVVQNFRVEGEHVSSKENAGQVEELPFVDESLPCSDYRNPTTKVDITFFVQESGEDVDIIIEYYTAIFKKTTIKRLASHFCHIIKTVTNDPSVKLKNIEIITREEKEQLLYEFNSTTHEYPGDKTIHQFFQEQVEKTPDNTAVLCAEQQITYKELERESNQLARYLCEFRGVKTDQGVGMLLDMGINAVKTILGILKSGGAYVPIDPSLPEERKIDMVKDAGIGILLSEKKYIRDLNRLLWECDSLFSYLCMDSHDIYSEDEGETELMDKELWHHVGETATDDITGGGWISSYTGEPMSGEEMDEYGDNILKKLEPLLHEEMRVLEIGTASGISMYRIAPKVGLYYGTDLSEVIIEKNKKRVKEEGYKNIKLSCFAAHEIEQIEERDFDLVIINSVIQAFPGYNYLRKVIKKSIHLLRETGYLFLGDIMDLEKKDSLIQELVAFKNANINSLNRNKDTHYTTKIDFSSELFISRGFWRDLGTECEEIEKIEFSDKIHTIENELTKFRYDTLITVNKKSVPRRKQQKLKFQDDLKALSCFCDDVLNNINIPSHSLSYIIFTSGTTGKPKAVAVEHRSLLNYIYWRLKTYHYSDQDVTLQLLSYSFDGFASNFYSSLLSGGKLILIANEKILDYEHINSIIRDKNVTNISLVPSMYEVLLHYSERETLKSLRFIVLAGEKTNAYLVEKSKEKNPGIQLINEYGPTEAAVTAAAYIGMDETNTAVIGSPIWNVGLYILDHGFCLQPIGVAGELCIWGAGLARGYLNHPEPTAEKFDQDFQDDQDKNVPGITGKLKHMAHISYWPHLKLYRTGDLARWLADGNIEYLGRIDRQVKIRGFRIELEEIENRLLKHEAIKEAVVIDRREEGGDSYLCAYVVFAKAFEKTVNFTEFNEYLSHTLPDYMIPSYVVPINGIPLTPSGKINRKALPIPEVTMGEAYTAPRNEIERNLMKIWSEVLGMAPSISIDDNFFQLGGHSLKATVLVAKIHKELNVKLPLAEVFKAQTIREQAKNIKELRGLTHQEFISIEPAEEKEYYPLSSAQERLFILQQLEPGNIGYNIPHILQLEGEIDIEKLEMIFKTLISRHESLRTSFEILDERPVQKIHRDVEFNIELYDLTAKAREETRRENEIHHFIRPFDFSQAPLLRVRVLKMSQEESLLLFDLHHIITDGTSQMILTGEFMSLYAGKKYLPHRLQYKDYSEWQNSQAMKEAIKQQEAYWLQAFEGEIPLLNMPADYPRPMIQSFEGSVVGFEISEEESNRLYEIAHEESATLFMALLAAFSIFLAKITGQEDTVVGTPTAGRRHADLERIIGMFVNTLALRNFPSPEKNAAHFLIEVKERTLEAFENQDYQFEDLVEKAAVARDMSRNPLFDVMFALQNVLDTPAAGEIKDLKIKAYDYENKVSKFDLTLTAIETGKNLYFSFEYCTKLFKRETIKRFIHYFKRVISSVIKNPGGKISGIEIITQEEKNQILYDFNDTNLKYPGDQTMHQLFEAQVEKFPGKTAVVFKESQLTYHELNRQTNRLAGHLRRKGVRPDTTVGIMVERSLEMIVCVMAVLKAGGAFLPVDPLYPDQRIGYMLENSGAHLLLTQGDFKNRTNPGCEIMDIHDLRLSREYDCNLEPISKPGDLAYLIYTSGSTGKPKGVMVENNQYINAVFAWRNEYRLTEMEIHLLQMAAFSFDVFAGDLARVLPNGGRLVICPEDVRLDLDSLYRLIREHRISLFESAPALIFPLMEYVYENQLEIDHLKLLILGSDTCPLEDFKKLVSRFGERMQIINSYGVTEATIDASCYKANAANIHLTGSVPIGKPLSNVKLYVKDSSGKLQPVGFAGELHIGGNGVARGYLNNPALTAEKFNTSDKSYGTYISYKTGDLAKWLPDGNIEFLGRMDEQVKIRGFRIELGEIENRLLNHNKIDEALVIAKEGKEGDKCLCAYIAARSMELGAWSEIAAELREYLSYSLPDYMIPAYFIQIDRIPLTPNGKVDRKALPEPEIKAGKQYVAPRNETEKKLVEIWSEVLGIQESIANGIGIGIGIDDNFFHLGGHSLKATLMVAKVHKELNVKIPLSEVFKTPFIRGLAAYLGQARKDQYVSLGPVEEKEYYALSSAQKRLYFLQQMDLQSTSYNMPFVLPIGKNIEKSKLVSAFKKLIARHESLRTSFERVDEVPVQKVHKVYEVEFKMEYYDLSKSEGNSPGSEIIVQNSFMRAFDLSQAPLMRSGLIKSADSNYIWMVDIHHIVSDGTSHTILAEDFISLYKGEELEPLELQYKDFSQWQNRLFESGEIKNQMDYWLNLYSDPGEIPRLHLPTDDKRPEVFTFAGDSYSFMLEPEEVEKFRALGTRNGGTLYMNLLASLNTLFYGYTGHTDIIIGSGIAGRPLDEFQNIIGMFVNTLAMRNYPRGEKTYESFFKEVIAHSMQAFENQDVQFEELVDRLDPERDPSRNPLFDVAMVVQNFRQVEESETLFLVEKNLPPVEYKNTTSKFDMTFFIQEMGEDVYISIEYYTGIFRPETLKRLTSHFRNVIKAVVKNPCIRLKDIEIISAEEKNQMLYEWNNTAQEYPKDKTIHQLFEEQVERAPDRTAVGYKNEYLSYGELDEKANQLANYLVLEKGTLPDDPVGILMDRSIDLIAAMLGILKAGGPYIPIDPSSPEKRIKNIINDAGIKVVISQKRYIRTLNRLQWECGGFHTFLCMDSTSIYEEEEVEKNELMDEKLWNYVGESAADEITGGGWVSSYTGKPFSKLEMDEYGDNILKKLTPLLHKEMRVLEIGCASGITMYRIAPRVGLYYGTDLSSVIIEKNKEKVKEEGHQNIILSCLPAHEIDQIREISFDLIILNSVIQSFHGHNYLRKVIGKSIHLLADKGYIFIGDIMDHDLKEALIKEMKDFKQVNRDRVDISKTKVDWSSELFVSRSFFEDLALEIPGIYGMEFSDKIYTIENELTKFRYDLLLKIDKNKTRSKSKPKRKYQHDLTILHSYRTDRPVVGVKSQDLAYIIYTSGTTGAPKGVIIEHQSLVNYILWGVRQYINDNDRADNLYFPLYTSISFDLTITSIFLPLISGNTIKIYDDGQTGLPILDVFEDGAVNVIKATPSHLKLLQDELMSMNRKTNLNLNLKKFIVGGEAFGANLARDIYRSFSRRIEIYNEYGPTEATVGCMIYKFDDDDERDKREVVSIGVPADNVKIYILDRNRKPLPINAVGEIYIGGDALARGYVNLSELTAETFDLYQDFLDDHDKKETKKRTSILDHMSYTSYLSYLKLYRTGDLGLRLPDGNIEFLGRIDDQVKIRGHRIEIKEIENQLSTHNDIKEAIVLLQKRKGDLLGIQMESETDDYLCCYWIPVEEGTSVEVPEIKEFLSKHLPPYMVPHYFIQLEQLPLTPSGKINRKALPEPTALGVGKNYTGPRDEVERKLVEIWSQILNINIDKGEALHGVIGIDDNFFQIGGHSLKATILVAKIHKELNVKLPLADVFKTPTIRGLSGKIKGTLRDKFISIEPVEKKEYYVLSAAQKRLYILHQMEFDNISYNSPKILLLKEDINIGKLEETFRKIISRHESLRTSFPVIGEDPVQKIHDEVEFNIEYFEHPGTQIEVEVGVPLLPHSPPRSIIKNFVKPFDLSIPPLLRVGLIKTGKERHLLLLDMHHIITDGASEKRLENEFISLYSGEKLQPLRLQYRDYSKWQQSQMVKEALKIQEEYWLQEFQGDIPILNMPFDFARPVTQSFEGRVFRFNIEREETKALKRIALEERATLFMVILAIYTIMLSKISGQEDIIVGMDVAGRSHDDLTPIIGMFVNTLALRNFPAPDKTFKEFLREVKDKTLKALENQDYQFEDLVERISLNRDVSRNPIFDVMFSFIDMETERDEIPAPVDFNVNEEPFTYEERTSKFDLTLDGIETAEHLYLSFEYCTKLFRKETIERFVLYFREIISSVIKNPNARILNINMISEKEEKRLLEFIGKRENEESVKIEEGSRETALSEAEFDF